MIALKIVATSGFIRDEKPTKESMPVMLRHISRRRLAALRPRWGQGAAQGLAQRQSTESNGYLQDDLP